MNLRPISDLAHLSLIVNQDELPVPARLEWARSTGLRVIIEPVDLNAWLRISTTTPELAAAATERRVSGFVFWDTPRLIDGIPVTLAYSEPVNEAAWRICNSSALSYEEAAEFIADWPRLDDEQQRTAWYEARDRYGVPESALPELDLAGAR